MRFPPTCLLNIKAITWLIPSCSSISWKNILGEKYCREKGGGACWAFARCNLGNEKCLGGRSLRRGGGSCSAPAPGLGAQRAARQWSEPPRRESAPATTCSTSGSVELLQARSRLLRCCPTLLLVRCLLSFILVFKLFWRILLLVFFCSFGDFIRLIFFIMIGFWNFVLWLV